MDVSLIAKPVNSGWGSVWQGGTADAAGLANLPGGPGQRILLVCLNAGELDDSLINHPLVEGLLAVSINDDPAACLSDDTYVGLVQAGVAWSADGGDCVIHCAAGISRSSYYDMGFLMIACGLTTDAALALIRAGRPQANPNSGFYKQVKNLESRLLSLSAHD